MQQITGKPCAGQTLRKEQVGNNDRKVVLDPDAAAGYRLHDAAYRVGTGYRVLCLTNIRVAAPSVQAVNGLVLEVAIIVTYRVEGELASEG